MNEGNKNIFSTESRSCAKKTLDTEHYNSKTKSTKLKKGTSKTGRCKLPFSNANLQSHIRKITTEILLFCKQLHLATQQAIKYTKCEFSLKKKNKNVNLNFLGLVHIRFHSKCIDLCAKTHRYNIGLYTSLQELLRPVGQAMSQGVKRPELSWP